jgi:hypothetical protein
LALLTALKYDESLVFWNSRSKWRAGMSLHIIENQRKIPRQARSRRKEPMPIGKNRLIWDLPGRIGDRLIPDPKASVPDCFGSSAAVLARG